MYLSLILGFELLSYGNSFHLECLLLFPYKMVIYNFFFVFFKVIKIFYKTSRLINFPFNDAGFEAKLFVV